jgi:hypothetical protein
MKDYKPCKDCVFCHKGYKELKDEKPYNKYNGCYYGSNWGIDINEIEYCPINCDTEHYQNNSNIVLVGESL